MTQLTTITVSDMVRWGVSRMRKAGVYYFYFGDPDLFQTARYLTFFALHLPYDYSNPIYLNAKLEEQEILAIEDIFNKRIKERLPTPYITNEYWYGPLSPQTKFYINKDVFVPRSPIYLKLKGLMQSITWKNHRVLDLGTGSGALGIISALLNSEIEVDLADVCPAALKVAQINIERHGLENRVECVQSNLFQNIKSKYDLIITVPPNLSPEEYNQNTPEFFHEPTLSLRSGKDGFKHIKQIMEEAPNYLNHNGVLAAEIGPRLASLIKSEGSSGLDWFSFKSQDAYLKKDCMFTYRKQE